MPDKMKKSRRKNFGEIMSVLCEVPQEVVSRIPVLLLRGQNELEVEGCSGIREYESDKIVLVLGVKLLSVTGESLELTDFREKILYVRGKICSVSYSEEGMSC